MDFPKSMPDIGLVGGRFVDENIRTGQVGSYIPCSWGNAVTEEIINVIEDAELKPDEGDNTQLLVAITKIAARSETVFRHISSSQTLLATDLGLVLIDATLSTVSVTLPASNNVLGVRDVILRRTDNTGNRLNVVVTGSDKIKLHTHLNTAGYPLLVLMGAGDWWHLRSDGAGSWWPVGRCDATPLGRVVFDTTTSFPPGGYGAISGSVFMRLEWPWLWDHAQQSGMLTIEAARLGNEGGWTSGDGVLTFRGPEGRGEFLRVLGEDRGVDAGRTAGSAQVGALQSHSHLIRYSNATGADSTAIYAAGSLYNGGAAVKDYGTGSVGGTETRPRNIAYPGRIKLI
ncbi:phage tail protein [Pseudomonas caspiana]|uniref:phage tail protein n=1 Tax=Pseudomonas caspiana TaxID=1451454 RepID=UPI0032EE99F6